MKFSAREDIGAPIEDVFRAITNFDGFERAALRRGADVSRTDSMTRPGKGMTWDTQFMFHNRRRKADLELKGYDAPNGVVLFAVSSGVAADIVVELVSLSRERTRFDINALIKPTTIAARLVMQPLKLARSGLSSRFESRISAFAASIEDNYQRKSGR